MFDAYPRPITTYLTLVHFGNLLTSKKKDNLSMEMRLGNNSSDSKGDIAK